MSSLKVSRHAVERWRKRVDASCCSDEIQQAVARFIQEGRSRPTPWRWMKSVKPAPGLRFIYAAHHRICMLVRDGAAVTVLTRSLFGHGERSFTADIRVEKRGKRATSLVQRQKAEWAA